MDREAAAALVRKYNQGLATDEEKAQLENWYARQSDRLTLLEDDIDFNKIEAELKTGIWNYAGLRTKKHTHKLGKLWIRIAVAASLILVAGAGLFYYTSEPDFMGSHISGKNDIAAGTNQAILTLGNGQRITLKDAKNGALANESNTIIKKTAKGELVYEGSEKSMAAVYNTIATPRGGQYTLKLSEGTKVILNAASTLRYPTQFTGKDRIVELVGEGYFEVSHDKTKPFKVISRGQTVEVLGTHFNINSYADEPNTKTTLLEGSVNVNGHRLRPNQQAILTGQNQVSIVAVDVNEAVAWKDGLFRFDHTDLKTLMRQIARWYDVEVVYEGTVKNEQFFGKIERSYTLSEVLKLLELNKVHVKLDGKRIIVSP